MASAPASQPAQATVRSILKSPTPNIGELQKLIVDIEDLSATYGVYDDKQIALLATALSHSNSLTRLDLDSNKMTNEGLSILLPVLRHHTGLCDLNLRNNGYGDKGAHAVAHDIPKLKALTKLNLIGAEGAKALCKALERCHHLTDLDVSLNNFNEEGGKALVHLIAHSKTLRTVNVEGVRLKEENGKQLGHDLQSHRSVTSLNCAMNYLYDISTFCAALANQQCTLTSLDLSGNYFESTKKHSKILAAAVTGNSTLRTLKINSCDITDEGAAAFAHALELNHTLTELHLSNNAITISGVTALSDVLRSKNTTIMVLHLDSLKLSDNGAALVAPHITRLRELSLDSWNIGPKGATSLAEYLAKTTTLEKLSLYWNDIDKSGGAALIDAMEKNNCTTAMAIPAKYANEKLKPLLAARAKQSP